MEIDMLTIHVLQSVIGDTKRETFREDWTGQTVSDIVEKYRDPAWGDDIDVGVMVRGQRVDQQPEKILSKGDSVVIAPDPALFTALGWALGWVIFANIVVFTVALGGIYYGVQQLKEYLNSLGDVEPDQSVPGNSATYHWGGSETRFGAGFRIPIVYGNHACGGQMVSSAVVAKAGGGPATSDILSMMIVLSEGRIESVGSTGGVITGGTHGEADDLGTLYGGGTGSIPNGILVNGNKVITHQSVHIGLRMGELDQSPMNQKWLTGPGTTVTIGDKLREYHGGPPAIIAESQTTLSNAELTTFQVKLSFPGGLYYSDSKNKYHTWPVDFMVDYATVANAAKGSWTHGTKIRVGASIPETNPFSFYSQLVTVSAKVQPPIIVRVRRTSDPWKQVTTFRRTDCTVASISYFVGPGNRSHFAYPRCAIMRFDLRASDKFSGRISKVSIPVRGVRVPAYDVSKGWQEGLWWHNAGVYSGIWSYPIGQNPAWVCAHLLTSSFGAGSIFSLNNLDADAFRDWADYCDQTVDDEAFLQFNGVFDAGESAWSAAQRIARIGRCSLVIDGKTVRPKYEYRDAHGRGTNSVPARTRQHLLLESNAGMECRIEYFNTEDRPHVLDIKFLNEDLDFEQDMISIEDPDAITAPHKLGAIPLRRRAIEMYGCTRISQARREGYYFHAISRLAQTSMAISAGIEHIGIEVGDIVGLQRDFFKPFNVEGHGFRAHIFTGRFTLDHDITIGSGTWQFHCSDDESEIQTRTIISSPGEYKARTEISYSGSTPSLNHIDSVPIAIGEQDKIVKDYVVTAVSLNEDLTRTMSGMEWAPDAHVRHASAVISGDASLASEGLGAVDEFASATDLLIERDVITGGHIIGWSPPEGFEGRRSKVYIRAQIDPATGREDLDGGLVRITDDPSGEEIPITSPELLGTVSTNRIVTDRVEPHVTYDISVCPEDRDGNFAFADEVTTLSATAGEFTAQAIHNIDGLAIMVGPHSVKLAWKEIGHEYLDYYEVRLGSAWLGAQVIGRTIDPFMVIESPSYSTSSYLVAARMKHGGYSGEIASVASTFTYPDDTIAAATVITDLAGGSAGGTHSGTSYSSLVALTSTVYTGTYTTAAIDAGIVIDAWWSASVESDWIDDTTASSDETYLLGSGEAGWGRVNGRPPSMVKPGGDLGAAVSTFTTGMQHYYDLQVSGRLGQAGEFARVKAQWQFYDGSSWGALTDIKPQRKTAQKMRVVCTLDRYSLNYEPRISKIELAAAL